MSLAVSASARRLALVVAVFACTRMATAAPLADITWGSATGITGDGDVDVTGTLVYAYNFGSGTSATTQTVNGVTFQPFVIQDFTSTQTTGSVTVSESSAYLISDVNTGSVNPPFSGLSASYQALLSSEVYASNFADMRVDLGGLTNGTAYRVQFWINDSSVPTYGGSPYFENVIASGSSTNVVLDSNPSGTVGSLGQFVIGTFTANGTTASFMLTGSGTGIWKFPVMNALQVRAVPEPSAYVMTLVGVACGWVSIRRRRFRN